MKRAKEWFAIDSSAVGGKFITTLIVLFVFVLMLISALESRAQRTDKDIDGISYHDGQMLRAYNNTIGTSAEILSADDEYSILAAADSLEIVCDASDVVRLRIVGIMADSVKLDTLYRTTGTDTVRTVNRKYRFLESVVVDSGALTDTLRVNRATGDTRLTTIAPGHASDYAGIFYVGKRTRQTMIKKWKAGVTSTTGTVDFRLRIYPDWNKASYYEADQIYLPAVLGGEPGAIDGVLIPRYGKVEIVVVAGTNLADGYAVLRLIEK